MRKKGTGAGQKNRPLLRSATGREHPVPVPGLLILDVGKEPPRSLPPDGRPHRPQNWGKLLGEVSTFIERQVHAHFGKEPGGTLEVRQAHAPAVGRGKAGEVGWFRDHDSKYAAGERARDAGLGVRLGSSDQGGKIGSEGLGSMGKGESHGATANGSPCLEG